MITLKQRLLDSIRHAKLEKSYEIIYDLLEAIPKQTHDADWWPDPLTEAYQKAWKFLESNDPKCKPV